MPASDLLDPATSACPFDLYGQLRAEGPTEVMPGMFVVSTYDDVVQVLHDVDTFSSVVGDGNAFATFGPSPVQDEIDTILVDCAERPSLLGADPPVQSRVRAVVNRSFTPKQVKGLEPEIRRVIEEAARPWLASGRVELVSEFAMPVPASVTAMTLGAPPEMGDKLRYWSGEIMSRMAGPQEPDRQIEVARNIAEMFGYFRQLISERRHSPRNDLISLLVSSGREPESVLTEEEIVSVAETFVVGGNETTTFLMSSIFLRLAQDPQLADRARADHTIIPVLIDEMLRLESPAQGVFRSARRDVTLGGKTIPGGAVVFVLLGSGNRDEHTFNHAAELHLDRNPSKAGHLAFGRGQHFCLGASLARSEVRIALEALLPRMHDLRLEPEGTVLRTQSMMLRGLARLDLAYDPA